jgi:uncharacterized protein YegL
MAKSDEDWGAKLLEAQVEFADNPEPRCACVLLLDNSGSMGGEPIKQLNRGLVILKEELAKDALARRRVEIAIVTFGQNVKVIQDFVTAEDYQPPVVDAMGLTPMGSGILKALEVLEARKSLYKANGVQYYRPWIFLITDGAPEGEPEHLIKEAAQRIKADEAAKRVAFFAIGVEGAEMDQLAEISVRAPLPLQGLKFVELFKWLSASMTGVSSSKVGDQVSLPPPQGWSAV